VTETTLPAIEASQGWQNLSEPERLDLVDRLEHLAGVSSTDRHAFARRLGVLPKAIEKALWDAVAVRDPEAPAVTDRRGRPEPDPDLRDNENVPLPGPVEGFDEEPSERLASRPYRAAVDAYVAAEALPYVPNAWSTTPRPRSATRSR